MKMLILQIFVIFEIYKYKDHFSFISKSSLYCIITKKIMGFLSIVLKLYDYTTKTIFIN